MSKCGDIGTLDINNIIGILPAVPPDQKFIYINLELKIQAVSEIAIPHSTYKLFGFRFANYSNPLIHVLVSDDIPGNLPRRL